MPSRAPDRAGATRDRVPLLALLTASFVSRAGNAVTAIAVPLYVFSDTGSALATGIAGVCATAPVIIGGALGGALVDRVGYRASSIVADVASGVTVLALPILAATGRLHLGVLLVLVFLSGLLDTPGDTAKTVMLPEVAARAGTPLARAAGAQSAVQRSASMVGAAVAGILIGVLGAPGALYVNAATFAVSALVIAALVPRAEPEQSPAGDARGEVGYWRDFAEGLRWLWSTALLRAIVLLVMATNAIDAAGLTVLFPVYATDRLASASALGFMIACFAGGALTGAVLFAAVAHRASGRGLFVVFFVVAGVPPYVAMALDLPFTPLLVVLAVSGLAAGGINPMVSTALYGLVPEAMRARVFGAMSAGVSGAMPLGAFLGGAAVSAIGLTPTLVAAACLYAVATLTPLVGPHWRGLGAAVRAASPDAADQVGLQRAAT